MNYLLLLLSLAILIILLYINIKYVEKSKESYLPCYKKLATGTDASPQCGMCKQFSNSYDSMYPHNARSLGVSLCNQGKIL